MNDPGKESAAPASVDDLEKLLRALHEHEVDYLLIGGYALQPHAVTIDFEGVPIRTLSLEGLLKTKQTSRDKDRIDRVVLERALKQLSRK